MHGDRCKGEEGTDPAPSPAPRSEAAQPPRTSGSPARDARRGTPSRACALRARAATPHRALACASAALVALAALATPRPAAAGPGDLPAQRGLAAAKKGDCVKAIPLLEDAELARHRPLSAMALADCYLAVGELLGASQIYHAVAEEKPARTWVRGDYNAQKQAAGKASDVDARIPTVRFVMAEEYEELEIQVNGKTWPDPTSEQKVTPDAALSVVATAKGRKDFTTRVVPGEGQHKVVSIRLERSAPEPPVAVKEKAGKGPTTWLGARYRGVVIPRFVMHLFGDGGTNVIVPGAGLTLTTRASDADIVISLGYMSYKMGETPYKPKGRPDTEYEIISSDLQALTATVDLLWSVPLDSAGDVSFRFGGGLGVGWTFAGNLYRTQAYPANLQPGDPYSYLKCNGPDDPRGSYRYCNELDKDKNHYNGFKEPSWFQGGARPLVYPWIVLPELGLSFKVSPKVALDVDAGLSLSGILTSAGIRFGL